MSIYSWSIPSPPSSPIANANSITGVTVRTSLGGLLDMYLDPVTLDYASTTNGEWVETADSRTMVMIMIETRLGADHFAPGDGTNLKDRLEGEEPVQPQQVIDEVYRAMQVLVEDGSIKDVAVASDFDETGRFVILLNWRDCATSSPVDLVYAPFQEATA